MKECDVVIAGLGAMGSAAIYHLAGRGRRVAGLDRLHPPHDQGSSHGRSRIIREAYFEHPLYVPLVQRAYELWGDLERKSGKKLLLRTGGLMIGPADGALVRGAKRSAEEHRLEHQLLIDGDLRRRFQVFELAENMVGLWEPRAGILFPEQAVETHLELAAKAGAELHYNEPMLRWEPDGRGVRVFTAKESFRANKLLLSTGAWMSSSVPGIKLPLQVERQVMFWFEPRVQAERFAPEHCPIHIWEYEPGRFFYGFPDLGDGVKTAVHHQGEPAAPETARREVDEHDIGAMRSLLRRFMPSADGNLKSSAVCLYTNTPDEHFILDWHPELPQVLIASPCSGHGFKFSSVIGELEAMLLNNQRPPFDLGVFKISRFVV